MSNITYNEKEEAYELPYELWDTQQTVRFYVDDEAEIMENISAIAQKLAKLDGGRKRVAELLIDDGYFGGDPEKLEKSMYLENVHVDIEDGDIIVCFDVGSTDGFNNVKVYVELIDYGFETAGIAEDLVK